MLLDFKISSLFCSFIFILVDWSQAQIVASWGDSGDWTSASKYGRQENKQRYNSTQTQPTLKGSHTPTSRKFTSHPWITKNTTGREEGRRRGRERERERVREKNKTQALSSGFSCIQHFLFSLTHQEGTVLHHRDLPPRERATPTLRQCPWLATFTCLMDTRRVKWLKNWQIRKSAKITAYSRQIFC